MLYLTAILPLATLLGWRIYRVRKVRFDRVRRMEATYAHLAGKEEEMTYQEATDILLTSTIWDMPWMSLISLSFALFQTYAVPTISKVLIKTKELSSLDTAARRAEDTAIMLTEIIIAGLDTERGSTCLARTNFLHARYGSSILQGDLLFTLSLFIFEPIRFNDLYEWRTQTKLEREARYVFWREAGARMGIQGIPRTSDEFYQWKEEYAKKAMVYATSNSNTGEATMAVFLKPLPGPLKPFGRQCAMVLVPEAVRKAFGWERASPEILYTLVPALLRARAWVVGNLMYPRTTPPAWYIRHEHDDGRITRDGFVFEPWYVTPGKSSIGELGTGQPGKEFQSEGWRSESIGPERLKDVGVKETLEKALEMRERAAVCPFFA